MKVGITGHQTLNDTETNWLNKELEIEVNQIKIEEAYSCLAAGADQIFAKIIIENKISLIAVIPCRKYEQTFKDNQIVGYKKLLGLSINEIQLDFEKPTEEAFYEAGKTVVNKSDILFACWNNLPAKGLGGTADIVSYAKRINKRIIHLNPLTKTKKYLNYG